MQCISKALVAGGLVILTGPFCLTTQAQDYVDLEAERSATSVQSDPYGAKPAQVYPATSYGMSPAPARGGAASAAAAATGQSQGQNLGILLTQVQQLQQEVMRLNGMVEEQAHELRQLKEQSLQRYMDLDKRLGGTGALAGTAVAASSGGGNVKAAGDPVAVAPDTATMNSSNVAEQPGEGDAYRAAYALVRGQEFDTAVGAFKQFLQDYPDGKYAPNAHYWLGELFLVIQPTDLEASRQSFTLLLSQYPNNNKAPDALYKLGRVYYQKGNPERAREYMERVIREYGKTNSSAVQLARDFIDENY